MAPKPKSKEQPYKKSQGEQRLQIQKKMSWQKQKEEILKQLSYKPNTEA